MPWEGTVVAIVSAFSTVVNGKQSMSEAEYCRTMYIHAGGDKIRSGLGVKWLSDLTVQLASGDGVVGGIAFQNTGVVNLTTRPNSSLYPRIDLVVARKLPSMLVVPFIVEGVAAATPTVPAARQDDGHAGTWDLGLGYFFTPGSNGATITDGRVYGVRQEFSESGTPDPSPTVPAGGSVFVKSTRIEVPGRRKVSFEAWVDVECPAGMAAGGTVLLQCGDQSWATPFKSETGGSKQVYAEIPEAIAASAGAFTGNVSVTVDPAPSQAVKVSRFTTRMRQWT